MLYVEIYETTVKNGLYKKRHLSDTVLKMSNKTRHNDLKANLYVV